MSSTPGTMARARQVGDTSLSNSHSNSNNNDHRDESVVIGKQDTTGAANNSRSIRFDDDNELTRLYEEEAIAASNDGTTDTPPPTYSRFHRDSGVSVGSEPRDSSKFLTIGDDTLSPSVYSQDASPAPEHRPTLRRSPSNGRSVPARLPSLPSGKDEGRIPSLGPAMEQWRLTEEEEQRHAKRNGVSPALAPQKSRSSFGQDGRRRISLSAAMEQWRLEEDEEWQAAKRNGAANPALLTPTSLSPSTSPSWSVPSEQPSQSYFGQVEARRMSLGPAMEQWRLEEDDQVRTAKRNGEVIPALLSPASPRALSGWPSRSSFGQNERRRPSLGPAMEQWRLDDDDQPPTAEQTGKAIPSLLPSASPRTLSGWPSRSSFGQDEARRPSLGPSMEQWRLEELDELKSPAAVPLAASRPMQTGKAERVPTLGPAMEAWRQEEMDW